MFINQHLFTMFALKKCWSFEKKMGVVCDMDSMPCAMKGGEESR